MHLTLCAYHPEPPQRVCNCVALNASLVHKIHTAPGDRAACARLKGNDPHHWDKSAVELLSARGQWRTRVTRLSPESAVCSAAGLPARRGEGLHGEGGGFPLGKSSKPQHPRDNQTHQFPVWFLGSRACPYAVRTHLQEEVRGRRSTASPPFAESRASAALPSPPRRDLSGSGMRTGACARREERLCGILTTGAQPALYEERAGKAEQSGAPRESPSAETR